ncbi:MAG: hypothetical protein JSS30_02110 [Verrucomicrobia bacterium]|nr:hypothetical protein [Verrucomicrobiota bacterium]
MFTALPNSVLLIGASKENALDLAKQILGPSPKIDSGNHPDLHLYAPEGKSELHPIASIHQMISEMAMPPFEAKNKVFVIEDAEKMLPSSSNALLKTLEEPNQDTYFLMMTHHPDRLLPTIVSRLFPIQFQTAELPSTDFTPYIALASQGQWDKLLDELPQDCPEDFLKSCLQWAASQKNPESFLKLSKYVEEAEKALEHNLKPRTVFLNLLLLLFG